VLLGIILLSVFIGLSSAIRYHFPIAAGGLFLNAAHRISANNYKLPSTLPHYGDGGVPFAYPPLMLYALALLHDATGISLLNLERALPALLTPLCLAPFYFLAREVLKSKGSALFATFIMAVSPSAFFYHLDAGGVVRAPAFALLLAGLLTGHRMFRTGDRTYVALSAIAFALTLLSHVGYATLFAASYVVFLLFLDRSRAGLGKALLVGVGGLLISAPWWLYVVHDHGLAPFIAALSTHRSVGGTVYRTLTLTIHREPFLPIWHVLGVIGILVVVAGAKFFLPVWLAALMLAYPTEESIMIVVSLLAALAVFEVILPAVRQSENRELWSGAGGAIVVAALSLYGFGSAMAVVQNVPSSDVNYWHPYIDQSDVDAMQWASQNTPEDARFIIVGSQAEWFPALAGRTSVVGEWGAEWKSGEFGRQRAMFADVVGCGTKLQDCLLDVKSKNDLRVDYVYIPETDETLSLRHSIAETPTWERLYDQDGVAIYRFPAP
jgi:hypothetical protein